MSSRLSSLLGTTVSSAADPIDATPRFLGGAEVSDHGVLAANPSTRKRAALPLSWASRHPAVCSYGSRIGRGGALMRRSRFPMNRQPSIPVRAPDTRTAGSEQRGSEASRLLLVLLD